MGTRLFTDEVRARFDLVGFDPRGIARRTPLRCFDSPSQWPASLPFAFPLTRDQAAQWAAKDRALESACRERGGPILNHMSTANAARDLDVLRELVGDDQLSYDGTSYGTYLGVTYANLFPHRVRALCSTASMTRSPGRPAAGPRPRGSRSPRACASTSARLPTGWRGVKVRARPDRFALGAENDASGARIAGALSAANPCCDHRVNPRIPLRDLGAAPAMAVRSLHRPRR